MGTGPREPTVASSFGEQARCSTNAARKHLNEFAELETRDEAFQGRFSAPTPEAVDIPEQATHDEIETQVAALREWSTVRKDISRHTDAVRMVRRSERV